MSEPTAKFTLTWHPFTPKGAAGAAQAPRWQLWIGLGLTAALAVITWLNFLAQCWTPVIVAAIDRLDDGGVLRQGVFYPGGAVTDVTLARNRHLAIALHWNPAAPRDQASDVRVFLEIDRALVCSILGCVPFSYQWLGDATIGRTETGAWWRAWSPAFYGAAALGCTMFIVFSWWLLVVVYAWAIRLFAFYLDRRVDFPGAARVAQSALIPGALWLTTALYFYTRGWLDLFGLLVVLVVHVPLGWLYAGLACRHLPLQPDVPPPNPFQTAETSEIPPGETTANPFRGSGE
jgi:hypothetical protein